MKMVNWLHWTASAFFVHFVNRWQHSRTKEIFQSVLLALDLDQISGRTAMHATEATNIAILMKKWSSKKHYVLNVSDVHGVMNL